MPKCDSCITGEAFHTKAFRLCRPATAIEVTLDLCPICFAVSNQLYAALVRKEPPCPLSANTSQANSPNLQEKLL